jgi:HSP20 family molecular chaperone IbpA
MHATSNGTLDVDAAMHDVARIYRTITGQELPRNVAVSVPIPPEKDARQVARETLAGLGALVSRVGLQPVPPIAPPVDCWESERELTLVADLPGVERDTLRVNLERTAVVVTAERGPRAPDNARPAAVERATGLLARTVMLPPGFAVGRCTAELRDGVLRLVLERGDKQHDPRTVEVA